MGKFIFDGETLHIHINEEMVVNGVIEFTVEELWTEWVDWMAIGDNSKYPFALRLTGGDPIGGGQAIGNYVFLRNDLGWVGKPPMIDGCKVIINGAFYAEDPALPVMENNPNQETGLVINRSSLVTTVASSGTSGVSLSDLQVELKKLSNLVIAMGN